MDANHFEFSAVRGVQAGAAYFVVMCPLKQLGRLLRFDDDMLPADVRSQRTLNRTRVPAITRYVLDNPRDYIFSSLCASVDGDLEFIPAEGGSLRTVGKLRIGMSATLLINDGQHRWSALEEAVRERPSLGDETISIVLFVDRGLSRSQQMFADLNSHTLRPSKSIRLLYDHRDEMSGLMRRVVEAIPLLRNFTSLEASSLSARSLKLFTLSNLHQATAELLGRPDGDALGAREEVLATDFWRTVIAEMPDWQAVERRNVVASELRRDMIHAHGVAVQAIGFAGRHLVTAFKSREDWREKLGALRTIDWSRSNTKLWEGRALVAGKLNKSRPNVLLIANVLMRAMDLPLTPEGEGAERAFRAAHPTARAADDRIALRSAMVVR